MSQRMSLAERVSRNNLAIAGAKTHAAELPAEVKPIAAALAVSNTNIESLNAKQENAKQAVALLTQQLNAEAKKADGLRAKVVKAAEFTFGVKAPQLKEFRPVTEGRG